MPTLVENELDFSSGEFGPADEESHEVDQDVQNLVNEMMVPQLQSNQAEQPSEEDESYMTEVDKRLEVAKYFRFLLNSSLFSPPTPESQIVERKIRVFVKDQLHSLLSMGATPSAKEVKLPFSENEIKALKLLATLSETEFNIIKAIVNKMTGGITKIDTTKAENTSVTPINTEAKSPVVARPTTAPKPIEPPKKKPGRPPKVDTVVVVDPITGKEVKAKATGQVKSPGAIPMPTGESLTAATMMKASQAAAIQEQRATAFLNR